MASMFIEGLFKADAMWAVLVQLWGIQHPNSFGQSKA